MRGGGTGTLVAAGLFLGVLFAGCVNVDLPGAAESDAPVVVTDPRDFSYLENETRVPMDEREHVHDYWGGKDVLQVMDQEVEDTTSYLADPVIVSFRPEKAIPLGTSEVHVSFEWTLETDSYVVATEVWVKTAADQEARAFSQIENGQTVVFPSTNLQNDLPHQAISSWDLQLRFYGDENAPYPLTYKRFSGAIHGTAKAVRGLEIPPFPAHPDLWQNRTELPLVLGTTFSETRTVAACRNCDSRIVRPDEGAIVPYDAAHVEVVVEHENRALPNQVDLRYHGGDTREWNEAEEIAREPNRRVYRISVTKNADSPYAVQSLWEFYTVFEEEPVPAETYDGEYRITAAVYRTP